MMAQYLFFLILFTAILIHVFLGRGHAAPPLRPTPTPSYFPMEAGGGWRRRSAKVCSSVFLGRG